MAYKAYITEALICGGDNRRTSDRSYLLFTREAGMLRATARSVREERSKQRYVLQDFSYARLTLVRGKQGWRVTGTEAIENPYLRAERREERAFIVRLFTLLRRVVQGETPHPRVFDDAVGALCGYRNQNLSTLESIVFIRILNDLGYISPDPSYDHVLRASVRTGQLPALSPTEDERIRGAIERALAESHL